MLSINSIYILFFTTGVTIGFGHCIGMCGPIVISLSLNLKGGPSIWPHLFYNCGRTLTYGLLGGIVGGMASFTRFAESIDGLQKGAMVAAGVMIMLMGLAMTGWIRTSVIFRAAPPVGAFITRTFKQLLEKKKRPLMYLPIGLLLGLLPCGPVYTALLAAARSGMEAETTLGGLITPMEIPRHNHRALMLQQNVLQFTELFFIRFGPPLENRSAGQVYDDVGPGHRILPGAWLSGIGTDPGKPGLLRQKMVTRGSDAGNLTIFI